MNVPWRAWTALAIVGAAAFAVDASIERRRAGRLASGGRIGRFIPEADRAKLRVAGVRLVDSAGRTLLFVREQSVWRCPSFFDAVASSDGIGGSGGLIPSLLDAEGAVHSEDPKNAAAFGFGAGSKITVLLHGSQLDADPTHDVQLAVELGSRFDGQDGGYVRRSGSNAVWAIDTDPWRALESSAGRPPLMDSLILPKSLPSTARDLWRVHIEHADGVKFAVRMEELPRDQNAPPTPTPEPPKREFTLEQDGAPPRTCIPAVASDYLVWWMRVEWRTLEDFRKNPPPKAPAGRVVFESKSGGRVELIVGAPRADGTVEVWNLEAKLACIASREDGARLLARPEQLLPPGKGDPWRPDPREQR